MRKIRPTHTCSFLIVFLLTAPLPLCAQQPTGPHKQKPAGELINVQERPTVVPRVMDQATEETTHIVIKLAEQRATLFSNGEVAIDTPISSGKRSGITPVGEFEITQKIDEHRSNIFGNFVNEAGQVVRTGVSSRIDSAPSGTVFQGSPMKYFMQIGKEKTDTALVGLHAGPLPGYPAAHGCIRLPDDVAPLIFERVKVGTKVSVQE